MPKLQPAVAAHVRLAAAESFRGVLAREPELTTLLARWLDDTDPHVRKAALWALRDSKSDLSAMLEGLGDELIAARTDSAVPPLSAIGVPAR